ncbi:MAG: glycosyltransferase family 39 protein [Acidobacteriota bacterium]
MTESEPRPQDGEGRSKNRARVIALILGSCWLVAMTLWYVWTATSSLRNAVSLVRLRDDGRLWLMLTAVSLGSLLLGGLIVLQFIFRRFPIARAGIFATAVAAFAFVVLRHQVRATLVAAWIFLMAYIWGNWVLIVGGIRSSCMNWERTTVSLAVGLALLSPVVFVWGMIGWLRPGVILFTLIGLTLIQYRGLKKIAIGAWEASVNWRTYLLAEDQPAEGSVLKLLLALIALYNFAWALTPERSFDALAYQLAVPRFYLEQGAIVDLSYFWHSYFARLVNSIFLVAMAVGGQISAKLIVFGSGLVAVIGVYTLARGLLSRAAGLWAAAIFYSTPLISWLSTVAYVDLVVGMFVVASWLAFLRWLRGGGRGWIIASGLLVGAVIGSKPNGAYAIPVMGVMLLWVTFRKRHSFARLRDVSIFVALALIIAVPWYWLTWRYTGNPVFPLFNGIFKSPYWGLSNQLMNAADFGVGASLAGLVKAPFALTFQTNRFDEVLRPGGVGLALVLLPLALFGAVVARKRARLLSAACLVYLLLWAFTFQYARYYIPLFPIVAALAVTGVVGWATSGWSRRLSSAMLWSILLAQGLLIPTAFGNVISQNPLFLISGRFSEEEFLGRAVTPYRAAEFLNRVTGPDDWVIGAGVEFVRYYLRARIVSLGETLDLNRIVRGASDESMAEAFDRLQYRYLFVNRANPAANVRSRFLRDSFLDRFATLEYRYNSTEVYRLSPKELERKESLTTNLLSNPGFEKVDATGRLEGWSVDGRAEGVSTQPHGGQRSTCVTGHGKVSQRVAVSGGSLYTLSHHVRSEREGQQVRMRIDWLREDGTRVDTSFEDFKVNQDWQWLQMALSVPRDATRAEIGLVFDGPSSVCFDDVWFGSGRQRRPE